MSEQQYRATNFKPETLARIKQLNAILAEYEGQKLTSRQVFYQLVSRGWIDNTEKSYKSTTSLITDARYAGLVDWDIIEDRGREPDVPSEWDSIDELVDIAVKAFRLPRWADQDTYVELWVEKQALAGVLAPIARRHHVTLMVNKGYSSASAMKDAAGRMHEACKSEPIVECENCGAYPWDAEGTKCTSCETHSKPLSSWAPRDIDKNVVVLYLGDHDPSGEDMVRDIRDRLTEFGVPNLDVQKIALTMAQIKKFKPPPNPAKITDSRAAAYIAKYGDQSWELDALPPRELNRLVEQAITGIVDRERMDAIIAREVVERDRLTKALAKTKGKTK